MFVYCFKNEMHIIQKCTFISRPLKPHQVLDNASEYMKIMFFILECGQTARVIVVGLWFSEVPV